MPAPDDVFDVVDDLVLEAGLELRMDDGVTLVADAWRPHRGGPWPVLLQRLPYGRAVASTPVLPHPAWFARRGFAVVVQDCRGRGASGGRFTPFVDEGRDGAASIEWAARLPFSDGQVATYGFSYQGLAQLYAAALRPASLRGVAAMMCCPDPYEGWTYELRCLRLPFVAFWSAQLAGQDEHRAPVPYDVGTLPVAAALGPDPPRWFVEWLDHPDDDDYWAARRPDLAAIEVPVFTVLGYFDDFSSGTARLVSELNAEAVCGPWAHMPWGTRFGDAELGADAGPAPVAEHLIAFFDRVFSRDERAEPPERVRYFTVGAGWRGAPTWPPSHQVQRWTATSAGNANSRHGDGRLVEADAESGPPDILVVEPLVPYPGDAVAFQDESASEDRRDVLCYTGGPLPASLDLAGSPLATITASCDRPNHDIVVTLVLVAEDGTARALTGGALRCSGCDPAVPSEHLVALRPIAWRVAAGGRLRLDVSGARFPAFDRNPHTDVPPAQARAVDTVVATIAVSRVVLDLPVDAAAEK
jgi:putative CocE/NonD family hydrolase